ncbi:hypothetical protein BY996DRAFT_6513600 [Phakopsora pachyrhizi]|nr:hypothetical protein BY996DRAFT_6513600 [Phakopsora pachyrhizi]
MSIHIAIGPSFNEENFKVKNKAPGRLIKQKAKLAEALRERESKRRGRIKRVFKENVLGKLLVAGSKLKFERAQHERPMAEKNYRLSDSVWAMKRDSLPLNNSRPAPSTDPVVVESQSRGDLKVDHQPLLVDKSLTRKLSRVEGVHWRGLFDYVDPVEMNSGFRLMGKPDGGISQEGSEPSKAINGSGEVLRLLMKGMDVADGRLRLNIGQSEDWNLTSVWTPHMSMRVMEEEGFKVLEQDKDSTRIKGQKSRGYRIKRIEDYKKKKKDQDREAENRGVRNKRTVRRKALV